MTTTVVGGAGLAAVRTVNALNSSGIDAQLLSRDDAMVKVRSRSLLMGITSTTISSAITLFQQKMVQNSTELITTFSYDLFNKSKELESLIKSYDVIHLHASYNFFKLETLLAKFRDKPIVVTLHDQRILTGGCHYSTVCNGLTTGCRNCPKVRGIAQKAVALDKKRISLALRELRSDNLHLVAPSKWMQNQIYAVPELFEIKSSVVNNCVPNSFFSGVPAFINNNNQKRIGVVGTDLDNPHKGIDFFFRGIERFAILNNFVPEIVLIAKNPPKFNVSPYSAFQHLQPSDETSFLAALDSLSVVCVPSSSDNSPNVVIEALARRINVAASNSGGTGEIPKKIGLQTFTYGDIDDFCEVMSKALKAPRTADWQHSILLDTVSESVHASRLLQIYESLVS